MNWLKKFLGQQPTPVAVDPSAKYLSDASLQIGNYQHLNFAGGAHWTTTTITTQPGQPQSIVNWITPTSWEGLTRIAPKAAQAATLDAEWAQQQAALCDAIGKARGDE